MLLNLKTEIAHKKLSQAKVAREIGICPESMSDKVLEKTKLSRDEMYAIHERFFPDTDFKYLFMSDKVR